MHHSKLGLILILGSVGLLAIFSSRALVPVRSRVTNLSLRPTRLPSERRLASYHLLTPSRN